MNKKIDHLKTSVGQLKRDSKLLKYQNAHFTKQINELKSSVSKLEFENKQQEMKTERLEAQSRRESLLFYGFDEKVMNLWKNQRPECKITLINTLKLMKLASKLNEHIVFRVKLSTTHYSEVLAL